MDEEIKKLIEQLESVQNLYALPYEADYFAAQLIKELKTEFGPAS